MTLDARVAAAQLLGARRIRDELFGADSVGFGEPAWDVLLYLQVHDGEPIADADLIGLLDIPAASTRRYIAWLITRGLVERVTAGTELTLAARGRELLGLYLKRDDEDVRAVGDCGGGRGSQPGNRTGDSGYRAGISPIGSSRKDGIPRD